MLRHRWKILTAIAAVFVVLMGIEMTMIGTGPKKEVEAYKKSLVTQGEKLEISELVPPPVPPEQNGADIVNEALGMLTLEDYEPSNLVPAMIMISPRKAIVCSQQLDVHVRDFTIVWSNALAVVADDRQIIELLKQAADYPEINLPSDYPNASRYQYIRPLAFCAHRLSAEAMCELHRGDNALAVTNICTILALVNGQQDERWPEFQTARTYMTTIAARASWEMLQSEKLTDADLALLQSSWERLDFIHAAENAFSMQRAIYESEIMKMTTSDKYFNERTAGGDIDWGESWRELAGDLSDRARYVCARHMYRASWIYWDELRMLQNYQLILQTMRKAETDQFFYPACSNMMNRLNARAMDKPNDWLIKFDDAGLHGMYSEVTFQRDSAIDRTMTAEATRRIVVAAVALKRYELKHGSYPAVLSKLAPEFVSSVPLDPIDGKPLRYRLMKDGTFLLYSIGKNGKDDGGNGASASGIVDPYRWVDPDALDWVWPQPATPAEAQAFYASRMRP